MPVRQNPTLGLGPRLLKGLDYIFTQLALSQVFAILLDLARHRRTHHDSVTQRSIQLAMVVHPPERTLVDGQAMLASSGANDIKRLKVAVMPVLSPQVVAHHVLGVRVEAAPLGDLLSGHVPAVPLRKQPRRQRLRGLERHAVLAQAREELGLGGPDERV